MKLALWVTALARILLSDLVGNTQVRPRPRRSARPVYP